VTGVGRNRHDRGSGSRGRKGENGSKPAGEAHWTPPTRRIPRVPGKVVRTERDHAREGICGARAGYGGDEGEEAAVRPALDEDGQDFHRLPPVPATRSRLSSFTCLRLHSRGPLCQELLRFDPFRCLWKYAVGVG
jgi:hypothetical protein